MYLGLDDPTFCTTHKTNLEIKNTTTDTYKKLQHTDSPCKSTEVPKFCHIPQSVSYHRTLLTPTLPDTDSYTGFISILPT